MFISSMFVSIPVGHGPSIYTDLQSSLFGTFQDQRSDCEVFHFEPSFSGRQKEQIGDLFRGTEMCLKRIQMIDFANENGDRL